MTTETEWIDLPTLQDVAKALDDKWEIETYQCGWEPWPGTGWGKSSSYRGRPRQPKMKKVKMLCWVVESELKWCDEEGAIPHTWKRVPAEDKEIEVPCED